MPKSFVLFRFPNNEKVYIIESKANEFYNIESISSLADEHFVIAPFQVDSKTTVFAFPSMDKRKISEKEIMESDFDFSEKLIKGIVPTSSDLHQTKAGILRCKMKNGTYQKVVLSRVKKIKRGNKNLTEIFFDLCKKYKSAFIYLTQLPNGQIWCGASPETLASFEEGEFKTMALAGTQILEIKNQKN
jgi:isochorismate synthase